MYVIGCIVLNGHMGKLLNRFERMFVLSKCHAHAAKFRCSQWLLKEERLQAVTQWLLNEERLQAVIQWLLKRLQAVIQ